MMVFRMSLTLIVVGVTIAVGGGLLKLTEITALGIGIAILFFVIAGMLGYVEEPKNTA